jgi:hypothetical protein
VIAKLQICRMLLVASSVPLSSIVGARFLLLTLQSLQDPLQVRTQALLKGSGKHVVIVGHRTPAIDVLRERLVGYKLPASRCLCPVMLHRGHAQLEQAFSGGCLLATGQIILTRL